MTKSRTRAAPSPDATPKTEATAVSERRTATSRSSRRALLLGALLVGFLVLGVLAALTPHYETNDDVGLSAIAAGRYLVDRPDEHLLVSNVLLGFALKSLYQEFPDLPWYGGYLFLTAAFSLAAITIVCLQQSASPWNCVLTGVFLVVAGIPSLTTLQFTREGFLVGLAGLLLLAAAIRPSGVPGQKWFAIPLLLLGSLIRFDALLLACVAALPVIAWIVWRARGEKPARWAIAILVASLLAGWGAQRFDNWYYDRDPAWRDFHEFNVLQREFSDYRWADYNAQTAPVFQSAGWLPIDSQMMDYHGVLDEERFNTRTLQSILDRVPNSRWKIDKPWRALFDAWLKDDDLLGLWACGALCLAILATDRAARLVPLAAYAVGVVVCCVLYQLMHVPQRIYQPVFLACAVIPLVFASGPRSFAGTKAWIGSAGRALAIVLIVTLIAWRGRALWRESRIVWSRHRDVALILPALAPKPDQLFVIWGADFPFEYLNLPLDREPMPREFKVLWLGGTTRTPFAKARMEQFGFSDWLSFVNGAGKKYLVCLKDSPRFLAAYLHAHYGVTLKGRIIFSRPALHDTVVFQLAAVGTPKNSSPSPGQ